MARAPGYLGTWTLAALLTVSFAVVVVATPRTAAAEEPLSELVRFPPGTTARFSSSMEPSSLFVETGGAAPADLVEGWGAGQAANGADGEDTILFGTRFATDEAAASAALAVFERQRREGIRVRELGSLGDGWIATFDLREGAEELYGDLDDGVIHRYVHDGFRVRGRDILSFVYVTDQPTPPPRQLDHMAWHTSTLGGSTVALPQATTNLSYRIGLIAGRVVLGLIVVAVVRWLVERNRRTTRYPPTPTGAPTPRPPAPHPGAPTSADGEPQPPRARVIW